MAGATDDDWRDNLEQARKALRTAASDLNKLEPKFRAFGYIGVGIGHALVGAVEKDWLA